MDVTWKIAIGVCVGLLAMNVINEAIKQERVNQAVDQFQKEMTATIQQSNETTRAYQEQTRQAAERQKALERMAAQTFANEQRAAAAQLLADLEEQNAKEAAWKKFYKPSEACNSNWTGACADTFIIAKRAFKAQYKPQQ